MQPLNIIGLIVTVAIVALAGIAAIVGAITAASLSIQSASATTADIMTTTIPTTNVTTQGALASSGGNNNNNSNSNVTLGNLLAVAQGIDETYNQINDTYAEASYVQSVTLMPPNAANTTTINATESGNYTVNILPNGLTSHLGQAFLVTEEDGDGRGGEENATLTFVSLGYANPNGTGSRTGVEFFTTNSTGQLAFLDNMVAIYHIESSPERTTIRTWEWKGGTLPFENNSGGDGVTATAGNQTTTTGGTLLEE